MTTGNIVGCLSSIRCWIPRLLPRATEKGLTSQVLDVRETAEEFRNPVYVELIRRNFTTGLAEMFPEFGAHDWSESDQNDGNPS